MTTNLVVASGAAYLEERRLRVTVVDPDTDEPVDLTGVDLGFVVTPRLTDDPLISKATGAGIELAPQDYDTMGVAYIELEEGDTEDLKPGPYRWELDATDIIGVLPPLAQGRFYVTTGLMTGS